MKVTGVIVVNLEKDPKRYQNRPFPSCHFRALEHNLLCENEFSFTCRKNSFSYEKFCTKSRFEKEARDNSEMAYSVLWAWLA